MNKSVKFAAMTKGTVYNNIEYFLFIYWTYVARTGQFPKTKMHYSKAGRLIAIIYHDQYEHEEY
jgi:hypothetical protein